jgi:hypothetical protein
VENDSDAMSFLQASFPEAFEEQDEEEEEDDDDDEYDDDDDEVVAEKNAAVAAAGVHHEEEVFGSRNWMHRSARGLVHSIVAPKPLPSTCYHIDYGLRPT